MKPGTGKFPDPVDFATLIAQLRLRGMHPPKSVVTWTGLSRTAIFDYSQGSVPSHDAGERLIAMWLEVRGLPREKLPRRKPRTATPSHDQQIFGKPNGILL